jgi:hypothetical protein
VKRLCSPDEWGSIPAEPRDSSPECDSSVGIALGCGLDDRGSRVRFPAGAGNFYLHHRVQNGSGAHAAFYPMGTRDSFPGGKAAEAWLWPLYLVQRSRICGATPPLPQYVFMAWCLVKHRDNFTFTFLLFTRMSRQDPRPTSGYRPLLSQE